MLKVDLHCHSNISDGVLAPASVAAYARKADVDVWALTDHDEVSGVAAARAAALDLGMRFVAGVEISITWAGETVHIVGLQVDENNPGLVHGLHQTRSGRDARGREIARQLDLAGIPDAYEGALKFVGNPDLMSRTHFARYIVEMGKCANIPDVFKKYLSEGKPGYVEHRWATLAEAVGWIRGAGGVAVIAHPGRYRFSDMAQGVLFDEFKQLGGVAIEVVTGSHSPDQYPEYAQLANAYGFLASRGTDFHAPGESRVDFAKLPPLPANVTPIWHDWF
ncbi:MULTISPECIES: 3',5'-nucleoside bisphosphate phosphatase [unclassified Janthinobacterium]|uniref:3',5'-nucleoside bisphosphate phosphatase n=1 Tax=unclassified Janthinobacterium TaxID=2610881 RepID=UPI001E3E310D|nr:MULTISPECIES: 3',5'-nucleoside bisphosphate phosphatase [unclassified Janthinobacterium]MCC7643906.1 PHP domain-containing protein [Janthinobacterium sp. EB271-G4-3-1]MCC7691217.1 PHP domain-containing protein [Janthinobacterium sp. EB271-G4-3-2]